jgi:hypothetical protein
MEHEALKKEKTDLQNIIYSKTGEISIIRRNLSKVQLENAELKSSFVGQSLIVESDKKKIEQNYQNQLDSFQTQLIFKVFFRYYGFFVGATITLVMLK